MGNMTAALPDVHLPTLLLSLETWKIVLPYSISLAFVGLIETLLTQQVVDQMTETTSDTNRESCSQGITNMVCGCIGSMPGCAMIGQAIVNVKSGGRGRLSTLVAGVMLIAVLGFGSGLLNIIPLGGAHRGNDHRVHRDLRLGFAPFPQGSVAAGDFDDAADGGHRCGDQQPGLRRSGRSGAVLCRRFCCKGLCEGFVKS